jgi:spermidine synthase
MSIKPYENIDAKKTAIIFFIFFLSGISGLIYETVWLRMLIRILGNTVYATSVVLAAFMAGLAIGSFLIGTLSSRIKNRLRFYAFLEIGIGLSAGLLLLVFSNLTPLYKFIYSLASGQRFVLIAAQSLIMIVLLIVPTCLMGGTLPLLSSFVNRLGDTGMARRIGLLYGCNTLGACVGVMGSGLFLIGAWGERETVLFGVGLNFLVSLMAWLLSKARFPESAPIGEAPAALNASSSGMIVPDDPAPGKRNRLIVIAYGISGLAAISYEIIWTRTFQIQLGTSIYAFSMMLGCYLLGIALGSLTGASLARNRAVGIRAFGWLQLFIALYGLAGMSLLTLFSPANFSESLEFTNILSIPFLIVTPLTFALGLMFPAVSAAYIEGKNSGRDVGHLYGANTIGCILGSLLCGFVLISLLGTRGTMVLVTGINAVIGIYIILKTQNTASKATALAVTGMVLILCFHTPDPFLVVLVKSVKKNFGLQASSIDYYFHHESASATTTAFGLKEKTYAKHLYINGIGMTKLCIETKLMAHLPLFFHPSPKSILVICLGMGTALRSAHSHPGVQADVVELIDDTYKCFKFFHSNAEAILADPRIRHFTDDGRNFLLMRSKTYDVITIDPAPPIWSAGTVNLYTKEFFELCRDHLSPEGIMCLWIPPASFPEMKMIMKTYQSVFPAASVWGGPYYAGLFMISSDIPRERGISLIRRTIADKNISIDLNEWEPGPVTVEQIGNLYLFSPAMLASFTKNARIITDDHPYTEFPLWRHFSDTTAGYWLDARWLMQWKAHHYPR